MSLFSLSRAVAWLAAESFGVDLPLSGVSTDTRALQPGQLFVALSGPRFDGHEYVAQAAGLGAAAALVSRRLEVDIPQILVPDTRLALGRLAAAWRDTLPGHVVAITGSNGKTTVKEMLSAVLAEAGAVAATRGNLNNDIGLPLTLLGMREQAFLVLEMGANHPGEIETLTRIARPRVALITNAGRAHLEGFGSLEGVARAKGEIIAGLPADGVFVLNADDAYADLWRELAADRRVLSFGRHAGADVTLIAVKRPLTLNAQGFHAAYRIRTPRGELDMELSLPGEHNLLNALAVVAVAEALKIPHSQVQAGLAALQPVPGRLRPLSGRSGARLVDDSYNANPDSVQAALTVLQGLQGRRWLVLGDLAELGRGADELHLAIGVAAREAGIEHLWAVGPLSARAVTGFGAGGRHFSDQPSLINALDDELEGQDVVLVKGSRSAAMDQVVVALTAGAED